MASSHVHMRVERTFAARLRQRRKRIHAAHQTHAKAGSRHDNGFSLGFFH